MMIETLLVLSRKEGAAYRSIDYAQRTYFYLSICFSTMGFPFYDSISRQSA